MCWKYEDKYNGSCFDFLTDMGVAENQLEYNFQNILAIHYGVKVNDIYIFSNELEKLLSSWHERKIIEPYKLKEFNKISKGFADD